MYESAKERELRSLKESLKDTQPVSALVGTARTTDQVCVVPHVVNAQIVGIIIVRNFRVSSTDQPCLLNSLISPLCRQRSFAGSCDPVLHRGDQREDAAQHCHAYSRTRSWKVCLPRHLYRCSCRIWLLKYLRHFTLTRKFEHAF